MDDVVSMVFLSIDIDGQNILEILNFNVAMDSRLIQPQNRVLDNNVSYEMSFLWGAIYVGRHFCEFVYFIKRVPFL